MVSLRDAVLVFPFVAARGTNLLIRLRSARRSVRAGAAGGVWGGMPRRPATFFGRGREILSEFNVFKYTDTLLSH